MELDLAWLLVLPIIFGLGWLTARYDRGQQRRESRHVPKDILDGLSFVLSQDLEKATDALLSAARSTPDAPALHRAVGNLYRRRGLTDRAIQVHETALRNPELNAADRLALMMDLGRDYLAAGLFDRAEEVFKQVVSSGGLAESAVSDAQGDESSIANEARLALMNLSQRTRDWRAAICWANELPVKNAQLLGHFHCELAEIALAKGDRNGAEKELAIAEGFDAPGPRKRVAMLREKLAALTAAGSAQSGPGNGQSSAGSSSGPTAGASALQMNACRVCGFRSRQNYWQCPGCHQWDSFDAVQS